MTVGHIDNQNKNSRLYMVVDMSFTKKVKTVICKILIIAYTCLCIFFVNLLLTLPNEPLITCQSIS